MDHLLIDEVVAKLKRGELRIPKFQRGFVWKPDDVAFLMDSIYKQYPFGSILLWRTKSQLQQERNLGPFEIPDPQADYPIDYILDGQQRITSITGVFARGLPRNQRILWKDIYFDIEAPNGPQSSQFFALDASEVVKGRHFALNSFFDPLEFRQLTADLPTEHFVVLQDVLKKFQQVRIPTYLVETDEKEKISIVFERINRKGQPLDTFQLLTAWTWSDDFELQTAFDEIKDRLTEFGFQEVGEDSDLLLRCAAAVLKGVPSAESLLDEEGGAVRAALPRITKGLFGAIDFLKREFNIAKLDNLPYPTLLIPLTVYFADEMGRDAPVNQEQTASLKRWFWRVCFSHRYSSGTRRNLENDIAEILRLKSGEKNTLGSFECDVSERFFSESRFYTGTVDTSIFILLLANNRPLSLVGGGRVAIGPVLQMGNRSQFHHLFPQAFLKGQGKTVEEINCLANFCILSAADNRRIGSKAPSKYRDKLCADLTGVLETHFIPDGFFSDDFGSFVAARSKMLAEHARSLIK